MSNPPVEIKTVLRTPATGSLGRARFRRPMVSPGGSFQVRGVREPVRRMTIDERIVDVWIPAKHSGRLLVTHDGQNVFDSRTSTHHQTWSAARAAMRASARLGTQPPVIAAVWNDPVTRGHELAPERAFRSGVVPDVSMARWLSVDRLCGDNHMSMIADRVVPTVAKMAGFEVNRARTAVLGSSMGGLAALNYLGERPDVFSCALAFSVHWPIGGDSLVNSLVDRLPEPGLVRVWMENGSTGLDRLYGPFQRRADDRLRARGYREGRDFVSIVRRRSGHNEWSWARRLDQSLTWWLARD